MTEVNLNRLAERALRWEDGDDVVGSFLDAVGDIGGDQVMFGHYRTTREPSSTDLISSTYKPEWLEEYSVDQLFKVDPMFKLGQKTLSPFTWSNMGALTEAEKRFVDRSKRDGGLYGGVSLGLAGPAGVRAAISVATSKYQGDLSGFLAQIYAAAIIVNTTYWQVEQEKVAKQGVRLTPRQYDCLCWAAAGKTAQDTADQLNLSVRTVEEHLANAQLKLGAVSKFHAIWIAIQSGLISLDLQIYKP